MLLTKFRWGHVSSWTLLAYKTAAFGSRKPPKAKPFCTSVWLSVLWSPLKEQEWLRVGEHRSKIHFFQVMILLHLRGRQSWLAQAGTSMVESLVLWPVGFWGRRRDYNLKKLYNHWKQPFLSTYPCFPWAWGCERMKGRGSDSEAWLSHAFVPEILHWAVVQVRAGCGCERFGENSTFFLWIV